MPKEGVLSMHCSATANRETGESALLFGLSGTGKTTLSADPKRHLIGDDEHCWSDDGVFNIEGGCYAKAVYLSREAEPQIFDALRFGSVLENVVYDQAHHHVDFTNTSITENTRGAYPIEYIDNAKIPCVAGHPRHVILLTCDAFGVLPPVSRLTHEQAEYQFLSGYTAKVAGTEMGISGAQATFSHCFGAPFLVFHPTRYAELLSQKLRQHSAQAWLVNTGWVGGPPGVGHRIRLGYTRAIMDAIYSGELLEAPVRSEPVFGLNMVSECPHVPSEVLDPRKAWSDGSAYDRAAENLSHQFHANMATLGTGASPAG
jgi:phosphoenolpyruvate carboxykinase (ATP)